MSSGQDRTFVSLSGLDSNMEPALQLFEQLLHAPKPDAAALKNMVAGVLKGRADAKLNKGVILQQAMVNYAKYGPQNPFTTQLSEKELKALKPEQLTAVIQKLPTFQHRVLYYGPKPEAALTSTLNQLPPDARHAHARAGQQGFHRAAAPEQAKCTGSTTTWCRPKSCS